MSSLAEKTELKKDFKAICEKAEAYLDEIKVFQEDVDDFIKMKRTPKPNLNLKMKNLMSNKLYKKRRINKTIFINMINKILIFLKKFCLRLCHLIYFKRND